MVCNIESFYIFPGKVTGLNWKWTNIKQLHFQVSVFRWTAVRLQRSKVGITLRRCLCVSLVGGDETCRYQRQIHIRHIVEAYLYGQK